MRWCPIIHWHAFCKRIHLFFSDFIFEEDSNEYLYCGCKCYGLFIYLFPFYFCFFSLSSSVWSNTFHYLKSLCIRGRWRFYCVYWKVINLVELIMRIRSKSNSDGLFRLVPHKEFDWQITKNYLKQIHKSLPANQCESLND